MIKITPKTVISIFKVCSGFFLIASIVILLIQGVNSMAIACLGYGVLFKIYVETCERKLLETRIENMIAQNLIKEV